MGISFGPMRISGFTAVIDPINYIEDMFSTYLYTGNGTLQTINNGIDLSGKGGLTWFKSRSAAEYNSLFDTARGVNNYLFSNATNGNTNYSPYGVTAFNSNGFSISGGSGYAVNTSAETYVSWTFRKQLKFFDIVTYTGTGSATMINHNLGSTPGCIIYKRTSTANNWCVYHQSISPTNALFLNGTNAQDASPDYFGSQSATATQFPVGNNDLTNSNGATYIAYIFASDAGGFGAAGTDNVITCGSFSGAATVTLGWEPQWLLIKQSGAAGQDWAIIDNMRGVPTPASGNTPYSAILNPNLSNAESTNGLKEGSATFTATGFTLNPDTTAAGAHIYIAIRRGPMKTPTDATTVFSPTTATSEPTSTPLLTGGGFPSDMVLHRPRYTLTSYAFYNTGRLTNGGLSVLDTSAAGAASSYGSTYWNFDNSTAAYIPANGYFNNNGEGNIGYALYSFRRAPGFFDEVCFTGTSYHVPQTVSHNLGVVPELIITKGRSSATGWYTYVASIGNGYHMVLNQTSIPETAGTWGNTTPTNTVFTYSPVDAPQTYVAYLFATLAGVSKVGTYTGTGALQTINCGFASGARFLLIKRTDSTGDWYVWDSARGMTSGNDPYLLLNSTAAEVTNTNYVDTDTTGFKVTAAAPAAINASGGTYIFLAIA